MKWVSCGAPVLSVIAAASCNTQVVSSDEVAPANPSIERVTSRDAAPRWAVRYGEEFWRRPAPDAKPVAGASNVAFGDVINRVSHAIDMQGSIPSIATRTYRAMFEGSELRFAPRSARTQQGSELRVRTSRIAVGEHDIYRANARPVPWSVLGNTEQGLLDESADVIEHREASADGIELTWILRDPSAITDDVTINVAIDGLGYVGQTDDGIHYADASGRARARIENAVLVDARGQRWPIETEVFDGGARWHLDRATLAEATFPVALDPTIGPELALDSPVPSAVGSATANWSIASNGQGWFVAWADVRNGDWAWPDVVEDPIPLAEIYGARIDASGLLLDPAGLRLSSSKHRAAPPSVASNGTDYLVVWTDWREDPTGVNSDIYGTRVTAAGAVEDIDNIAVSTAFGMQTEPAASSNGTDYFVVWADHRNGADIYGTSISSTGIVVTPDGLPVSTAAGYKNSPCIASNGNGYLVAWNDNRNSGTTYTDIYGARISAAGTVADANGIAISTAANNQYRPSVASSGSDYLVVWTDTRNSAARGDIYGARVTATGTVLDAAAFALSTAAVDKYSASIASVGTNFYVAWATVSAGGVYGTLVTGGVPEHVGGVQLSTTGAWATPAIAADTGGYYALWSSGYGARGTRISPAGSVVDPGGTPLALGTNVESETAVASNGTDYLVTWADFRNADQSGWDIYAVRVSDAGQVEDPAGILISDAVGNQRYPVVASNGIDFFVAWNNTHNPGVTDSSISGARVTSLGLVADPNGIALSGDTAAAAAPSVASSGTEYFVVWRDGRNAASGYQPNIYGARVSTAGELLDPNGIGIATGSSPAIASNGTNYFVAWSYAPDPTKFVYHGGSGTTQINVYGSRVTDTGVVQDGAGIQIYGGDTVYDGPAVASNGTDYLVAWTDWGNLATHNTLMGSRVSAAGGVLDANGIVIFTMSNWSWNLTPSLSSDGIDYVAAWTNQQISATGSDIYASRISATGAVEDPDALVISAGRQFEVTPKIAATASNYLVAYTTSTRAAARLISDSGSPEGVNECALQMDNCAPNAMCVDHNVGFSCACNAGYAGDGVTCSDVDECALGTDTCAGAATCTNTVGSYDCTCNAGFTGDGHTCLDINECTLDTDDCGALATCTNTDGAFSCACNAGFTGDGHSCIDVDECATDTDACSTHATCTNTVGSYSCTCDAGFNGDGHSCVDIDECALNTDDCGALATCTNTDGGFSCACNAGYTGDGHSCVDIDECALHTDDCSRRATCTNTSGGFACSCNAGFLGDGSTCSPFGEPPPINDGLDPLPESGGGCDATRSSCAWLVLVCVGFVLRRGRRRRRAPR